jgi:hypothetical protein
MNPSRFFSRALSFLWRVLCFSLRLLRVAFTGEDSLDGPTPQFSPQTQTTHLTREREGSDGLVFGDHSSELRVGSKTECVLITRKFRATNLLSYR